MGRDKRNETGKEHFTKMLRSTMGTPAWRALTPVAQALYPWLKLEWRGPQNNNNGKIRLSVRQAAELLGINMKTAARGFHDLQAKGFLYVTEPARLGVGGDAKSPSFELTEIELPQAEKNGGRKLYKEWREGADFSIHKAAMHNPRGTNGKTKPRPQNGNSTVVKFGTSR